VFPLGHTQALFTQVSASEHTLPHLPQLLGSDVVFAQTWEEPDAGHSAPSAGGHVQALATQVPPVHRLPQPLQFCGSLLVSVHCPLQDVI
jgi:hypothetical protein